MYWAPHGLYAKRIAMPGDDPLGAQYTLQLHIPPHTDRRARPTLEVDPEPEISPGLLIRHLHPHPAGSIHHDLLDQPRHPQLDDELQFPGIIERDV